MQEQETTIEERRLRAVAKEILADAVFRRSPVLSRLLAYLIERSLQGIRVKSIDIATEGLGKSELPAADPETYARVVVVRLRRALAVYHASYPEREHIFIDPGSYEPKLAAIGLDQSAQPPGTIPPEIANMPAKTRWIPGWRLALLAVLVVAGLAFAFREIANRRATPWARRDLPTLYLQEPALHAAGAAGPAQSLARQRELRGALSGYMGLRLVDSPAADFVLQIDEFPSLDGTLTVTLSATKTKQLILAEQSQLPTSTDIKQWAERMAFEIASPSGVLHGYSRRSGYDPFSPYGCWLRFTEGVQTYNTVGDGILQECASQFYARSSQRPLAAFLFSWTLVDRAVLNRRQAAKQELIGRALDVVHQSLSVYPDYPALHIAEMRAYSFAGDCGNAKKAAENALADARGNRVIVGLAATGLVLCGDLRGVVILRGLEGQRVASPPWEHVALFVAAMMADDGAEAQKQMAELESFESGQPLLLLLKAANASHAGRTNEAEAALKKLNSNPGIRLVGSKQIINNLPFAIEIKQRLKLWLDQGENSRSRQ